MLKCMAEDAGVEGDVTNKSGRRIGVTRMSLKSTPRDVMFKLLVIGIHLH